MVQSLGAASAIRETRVAYLRWLALDQILDCFILIEAQIGRWIERVRKIHAHRTERRLVADAKAGRLQRIVEILITRLTIVERDITEIRVDVARVVKQNTGDIWPEQWEAEFEGIE